MAVTLRRLLEYIEDKNYSILAGKDNLDQAVRWTHMVESAEISTFLEGQEIAFTTGVATRSEEELFDMVKCIMANQATAIVLNIGPYIKKVPEQIIEYCEERDFPLITVPWETHMAQIMQIFCLKITEEDKANMELSSAVRNAIFFPTQEELYVPALERYDYSLTWSYCVAAIEIMEGAQPIAPERRNRIQKYIENRLSYRYRDVIIFEQDQEIFLIFHQMLEEEIKVLLEQVMKHYACMLRKEEKSFIGIGRRTKNMKCIAKSYQQAKGVLKLQKRRNQNGSVVIYKELGLYKLLLTMEDTEIMKEYYMEMMGNLLKCDETNHTDYCRVLECYLRHDGSVKEAAEELYVHRNTVNKKINRIGEITGFDLSSLDVRTKFKIAFMLQEIL